MRGVNVNQKSGYALMYTKIGALTGAPDALIVYCGLDTDYIGEDIYSPPGSGYYEGAKALQKVLALQLAHGWGPAGSPEVADLGCQVPVGNLTLTPATAENEINKPHTVTATASFYDFSSGQTVPVPGVTVTFLVTSGPNSGTTGTGVSDAQGQTTFTYTGTTVGNDVIEATATVNGVLKTATAQKEWVRPISLPPIAVCHDVVVPTDLGGCVATVNPLQVDNGSSDSDNDPLTFSLSPAGPYPKGETTVTLIVTDPGGLSASCTATITVTDNEPPKIVCPADIVKVTDPDLCSAVVTWTATSTDNCSLQSLECSPPSGSVFPKGTTTVTCTATDAAGNTASCTFTVTVNDTEKPTAACVPTTNPAGDKTPTAGTNPKSGRNPDGFYQLQGTDNCDTPQIYVKDSASSFVAGPFNPGDKVKITQAPTVIPNQSPMDGVIVAHIQLKGDAQVVVMDSSGNVSGECSCLVPPKPK
jgi:hypothetical protein